MVSIGVFSDSDGDLSAFDAALKFLRARGVERFLFAGGRYEDLDAWVRMKREEAKAQNDYSSANFLEDVERYLVGLGQVERPKAFGQTYELARAVEELAQMSERVLRAPERGSLEYQDRAIPKKALDMLGDTLCCVVHDKNDLDKEDMQNAMVLVHGKDLEAKVVQIGARFFVTPGRLTGGKQPTVGILDVQDKQVTFSAFTLDGSPVLEPQVLPLGGRTKLSVK